MTYGYSTLHYVVIWLLNCALYHNFFLPSCYFSIMVELYCNNKGPIHMDYYADCFSVVIFSVVLTIKLPISKLLLLKKQMGKRLKRDHLCRCISHKLRPVWHFAHSEPIYYYLMCEIPNFLIGKISQM